MSDEWNPNAPDAKEQFDNARDNAPAEPEQQPEQVQGIATMAELEDRQQRDAELKAKLQTPKMALTPSLSKDIKAEVDKEEFGKAQKELAENQKRTEYLEGRLSQRNLTRDFNRSR